jgi:predicted GNAT family acetyltransferase
MANDIDPVQEASEESFPASDSPAWAMGEEPSGAAISNNPAKHRFEASIGGKTAFLEYRLTPPVLTLLHTEVPLAMRGHSVGGKLAVAAFEFARHERLRVNPLCPFAADYIHRHPEYADLVGTDGI